MEKNREGYLVSETHRECTSCGVVFEKTNESVTLCKPCNSSRVKSTSPESKMLQRAKDRAKKSGREFGISLDDIFIPENCPILGIPLICSSGKPGGKKNSPSLDRINPEKGYVKDNVWVISHLANQMKSHATVEEMVAFATWVLHR